MFNSVNNPFARKIESSTSSDSNSHQREQREEKKEKKFLEQEEPDEVKIGGRPILTEDEINYMVKDYIKKIKDEHENEPKVLEKADKFLEKFDIQKFMKRNPNLTAPDFYMVMFAETEYITK